MENPDRFLSPGGLCFAFDFVCVGCLVVGCFALLTRIFQSGRFLGVKLHMGFWDAPKPKAILIGFVKLQGF